MKPRTNCKEYLQNTKLSGIFGVSCSKMGRYVKKHTPDFQLNFVVRCGVVLYCIVTYCNVKR
jgi:hypothetical protein